MHRELLYAIVPMLCIAQLPAYGQSDSVMRNIDLYAVEVKGTKATSKMKEYANGKIVLDTKLFNTLPQILGNADPLHYTQLLPEIQTNGEYRAGVNIQGCESSHNLVSIGTVPIYNPSHLLGFFSTFNASHFDSFSVVKAPGAGSPNRLGGELAMDLPANVPDTLSADISVGMIESQATVRVPVGKNTLVTASARVSYINLLYSRWLSTADYDTRYSFYDINFTLLHRFDTRNTLVVDCYGGNDNGMFVDGSYTATLKANWGNRMVALHHRYAAGGSLQLATSAYYTSYRNRFALSMQGIDYRLPSGIHDFGLKHSGTCGNLSWGADVVCHRISPQSFETDGTAVAYQTADADNTTWEMSANAVYTQPLSEWFRLEAGLRASAYGSRATGWFAHADPSLSLNYNNYHVEFYAGYSMKHQYLFQTGFSDVGLPTEFWMSSDRRFRPQYAHSVNLGSSVYLFSRRYKLSGNVFFKKLRNQTEYFGSVLDFVNSNYDLNNHLLQGKGTNCGFSAVVTKCSGKLNGWASYTYTRARRVFLRNNSTGRYAANHERPHEIDAVLTYELGKHWSFGATFVYASGTPYTAARYLALINGNIVASYGEHNASRLSPYCRLDLSVNYKWKPRFAKENGINLSFYNATGRDNALFYHISIHRDGRFSYQPQSFVVGILPSVSYFCKF